MNPRKTILFLLLFLPVCYLMAQPVVTTSVTQSNCNNNDGAVSLSVSGGLPPYTYEWTVGIGSGPVFSNSANVSNLSPGYYTIKVTDANNDYDTDSVSIGNGIQAYAFSYSSAVCPLHNGSAKVEVTGGTAPYSYVWSNGSTSNIATGLAGGSLVQVEVIDANGCNAYFYNYNVYPVTTTTIGETTVWMTSSITANYTTTPEECPLNNGTISLTPSGGTAPYTFYWHTTPVKNTATVSGLNSGYYTATVTDASGCSQNINTYVGVNAGALNVTATKTNDYCTKLQGTANLTITGGVPPYTVSWIEDGSSALSRADLGYGYHQVYVSDQNGCLFKLIVFIDDISPVRTWIVPTETDCDNISGSATAFVSGGAAPYTYQWNNGATSSSLHNLPKDYYSVLVKDVNGCKARSWTSVDIKNSCYGSISGKVFQDDNGNCVQDMGEYPIMNAETYMKTNTGSWPLLYDHYSLTNFTGDYSMNYVLPDIYNVKRPYDEVRPTTCPASGDYNITIPTSGVNYLNKDFAMIPTSLFEDAAIRRYYCGTNSDPRPGFNYTHYFGYENIGTLPSDGYIEVAYSDLETFVSSIPAADFYDPSTRIVRFNYATLMLGEYRNISLTFNLPPTTLLGSTYSHLITADIGATDPTPTNNTLLCDFIVVGSFDPNDLKVSPAGNIVETDSVLTYSIRFQNTGTYPAELVVIKDTLEANLDIESICHINASHDFKFRVLENRAIEFAFENIQLPDSTRDEANSHGYVNFRIMKKKNLSPGTQIKNKAEIYFDFNAPVVTNTTVNTITLTTGTMEKTAVHTGNVFPNPAKDFTAFRFEKEISSLSLMNSSGITVLTQPVNQQKEFELNFNLNKGMYFYKAIATDGNSFAGKLLIE